jgi:DNA-binding IclR family transcriptional regulator
MPIEKDKRAVHQVSGTQSIRRAMSILRMLAESQDRGVRLTDLVEELQLNRPTVHRILQVLVEEGAAEQEVKSRRYMIGQEVSALGLARSARFPIRPLVDPYLQDICDRSGDTTFLTIRNGFDSICLDRKVGHYPVKVLAIEVGARRPLGIGVAGVALLASLNPNEAKMIIKINEQRNIRHGLTMAALVDRVNHARKIGYAHAEKGVIPGTSAVSVSIIDRSGDPVGALAIAAVNTRLSPSRLNELVDLMREKSDAISRRLTAIDRSKIKDK